MGRPGSSRVVPGTASRLLETAMKNRPMSRTGIGLQTAVNVSERPITQQGLTGLKTGGGRGPQRQFQAMILPGCQTSNSASSSKFHFLVLLVALVSHSSNFHHWPLLVALVLH